MKEKEQLGMRAMRAIVQRKVVLIDILIADTLGDLEIKI